MKDLFRKYFELSFWILALTMLALMKPATDVHYSFCIFKLLSFKFCPGCGLGHSISYLFHGNISASFSAHPLGIFAVIIIVRRIFSLLYFRVFFKNNKTQIWISTTVME
ncbi:MAG: DUF2752 domain-containing protein [Bacteroidota bacterium]|nr:DUF2752 domain-containing protein [Bacteroidota bacterium]